MCLVGAVWLIKKYLSHKGGSRFDREDLDHMGNDEWEKRVFGDTSVGHPTPGSEQVNHLHPQQPLQPDHGYHHQHVPQHFSGNSYPQMYGGADQITQTYGGDGIHSYGGDAGHGYGDVGHGYNGDIGQGYSGDMGHAYGGDVPQSHGYGGDGLFHSDHTGFGLQPNIPSHVGAGPSPASYIPPATVLAPLVPLAAQQRRRYAANDDLGVDAVAIGHARPASFVLDEGGNVGSSTPSAFASGVSSTYPREKQPFGAQSTTTPSVPTSTSISGYTVSAALLSGRLSPESSTNARTNTGNNEDGGPRRDVKDPNIYNQPSHVEDSTAEGSGPAPAYTP